MLTGFGIFAGAVGVILSMWIIHVGFIVKRILKEQQETNRLLAQLNGTGSAVGVSSKSA
jgi:hypothetical protein